jgi:hypothetical protein
MTMNRRLYKNKDDIKRYVTSHWVLMVINVPVSLPVALAKYRLSQCAHTMQDHDQDPWTYIEGTDERRTDNGQTIGRSIVAVWQFPYS